MPRLNHVALVVACLICAPLASAATSLLGTSVFGSFTQGSATNFFDAANGDVPATGFLNSSPASPTVTIASPAIEFGFSDTTDATASADFDATTLTLDLTNIFGFGISFGHKEFKFQDSAFTGLTVTKLSDSFVHGGVTDSLVGDTLTIDWVGGGGAPFNTAMSAVFSFSGFTSGSGNGSSVPLPAAIYPGLITAAALACFAARRRLA